MWRMARMRKPVDTRLGRPCSLMAVNLPKADAGFVFEPAKTYLCSMKRPKQIIFDLGGVLFARNPQRCTEEFRRFFDFVRAPQMPEFWEEYDRGTWSLEQTKEALCRINGCPPEVCDRYVEQAIALQEPVRPTELLVEELKRAGYGLYVLSNMSREFIDYLRHFDVYRLFDGEVVSCEVLTVKPEPRIYEILLERYGLNPQESLFVDDRPANLDTARSLGLRTFLFHYENPSASCAELRNMLLGGCR